MLTIFINRSILSGNHSTRTTRVASALLVMVVIPEGSLGHSLVFLLFESNLKLKSKPKLVCNIYALQLSLTADQKLCHGSSPLRLYRAPLQIATHLAELSATCARCCISNSMRCFCRCLPLYHLRRTRLLRLTRTTRKRKLCEVVCLGFITQLVPDTKN